MTAAAPSEQRGAESSRKREHVPRRVTIGILALQGAFAEHSKVLQRLGADVREVRLPEEFEGLDGIVLPGGESTAMALIGERWGVFPRLKRWVSEGRPVWGTCAGMILLSDSALMTKQGGQSLVGGLNVEICRNYFGAQKSSFEVPLDTSKLGLEPTAKNGGCETAKGLGPYPAVFIRAPAVLEAGPGIDILCKVRARPCTKAVTMMRAQFKEQEGQRASGEQVGSADPSDEDDGPASKRRRLMSFFVEPSSSSSDYAEGSASASGENDLDAPEVIVALRKGNIVATAFHPELTSDSRWHEYFVGMVRQAVEPVKNSTVVTAAAAAVAATQAAGVEASTVEPVAA